MGADPATSVAGPWGELHDTPGVWIGDGSAFPTAIGHQPDDHDHGARAPHRGGDRRGDARRRGRRVHHHELKAHREEREMAVTAETQVKRQALHRRRVGRAVGSETLDVINASHRGGDRAHPRRAPPTTSIAPSAAARAAFDGWSQTPRRRARRAAARRSPRASAARADEIAATIAAELGMPIDAVADDPGGPADDDVQLDARRSSPRSRWEEEIGNSLVVREPVGVVGAITPWNYPLHQIAAKVAPGAGGRLHGRAQAERGRAAQRVHPRRGRSTRSACRPGVFNLVTGTGPVVGEAIAAHPDVDMVSFTGSTRAGQARQRARRARRSSASRSSSAASRPT